MSGLLLVMLALAAEPADAGKASAKSLEGAASLEGATVTASNETPPDDVTKIAISEKRTAAELRAAVHAALKKTATLVKKDPPAAADDLLPLFVELKLDQEMVKEDRDRYTNMVRLRLIKVRDQLVADAKKAPSKKSTATSGKSPAAGTAEEAAAAGGLGQADFSQELVDLIQKSIAPESWEEVGGNGVIMYFAPLQVLVIRQTDEVHEAIGGVVHQLRRAQ